MMKHSEIRQIFFNYFQKKDHYKVLSSPLVPAKDPTILFTNAGMNQFKGVFLQEEKREYSRAVSIQKCMRVSGKHNDFDEVGKTEFHHTFFEMMGNFSFGDYFKEKAIEYGWDLLTNYYRLNPDKLWVTVYKDDDEAFRIWEEKIGVPRDRILRLGDKDNFWQMGDTGPCGPCSEIHIDRGESYGPPEFVDGNRRYMEIWNLVFMQFFRDKTGKLNPLPAPSIDTGMGMERLTSILQGVKGNYYTDLFRPIIEFTAEMAGVNPDDPARQIDLKVIADHSRTLSFLISDGVLPSNDGRGYVLRRVLRRAAKHGKSLGLDSAFLTKTSAKVIEMMKDVYPELQYNHQFIEQVVQAEEDRFNQTLLNGLKRFEDLLLKAQETNSKMISGKELFKLSDTYGFPLDFAVDLANEKDIAIDYPGYKSELEDQREKSRASQSQKQQAVQNLEKIDQYKTVFTGYDSLEENTELLAIYADGKMTESLTENQKGILVFDKTPFYAESGGQVGDSGVGQSDSVFFEIQNTRKINSGAFLHMVTITQGTLHTGDKLLLKVEGELRRKIAAHHSVTHLLHAALREILGLHVKQAGSYVGPDKLRFDFTHFKALSPLEIDQVEHIVNRQIRENLPVAVDSLPYEDAVSQGAMAIFEEKYSDVVRMITMGDFSKELCGGTHLTTTGQAGFFKIVNETSISSGIRRIEAIAGEAAYLFTRDVFHHYRAIQNHFHQKEEDLLEYLIKLEKNLKDLEKQNKKKVEVESAPDTDSLIASGNVVAGIHTVIGHIDQIERKRMSTLADDIKNRTNGLVVLSTNADGKSAIIVSVHSSLTSKLNANQLVKEISSIINGNGGGKPDFAQAGGIPITDVLNFKAHAADIINRYLK